VSAPGVAMSEEIRYEDTVPSPEDYNRLRRDVGWPEMDPETVRRCLPRSLYVVCAFEGEEMVGTGRIVGDGASVSTSRTSSS